MKGQTVGDIIEKARIEEAMFFRNPVIGSVRLDPNGYIIINTDTGHGTHYEYDIAVTKCKTPADIAQWLFHLQGKNWADSSTLGELLQMFARIFEYPNSDNLTMKPTAKAYLQGAGLSI